jgi:hypothetical protein
VLAGWDGVTVNSRFDVLEHRFVSGTCPCNWS